MIRFVYNLLFPLALLVFMPGYIAKMRRRGNYRRNFGQRFGIYSDEVRARADGQPTTWVHAVSVGEVAVALKLVAKMRELDPAFRCVLTTTTTTGFAVAEKQASEWLQVMYNALDFLPIVRRAFAVIRPSRIILVEAEVWPNLAAEAHRRRIPLALVNARLSPRSERRFRRVRSLVAPTFRCLDLVGAQELHDIERWEALGVPRDRIRHVGSIKYDPAETQPAADFPFQLLQQFGFTEDTPILLGGSTHAGEEEILGSVLRVLHSTAEKARLIIAPRHVERTRDIRAALEAQGWSVAQRSEAEGARSEAPDCLLLDTTGELRHWYAVATVVFIGKSLTANGGQNPVEPIIARKPVVFGPHMENFARLAHSLVDSDAAVQIRDAGELATAVADLLRDDAARARLVQNAERVIATHRGATQRTAELIASLKSHGGATT